MYSAYYGIIPKSICDLFHKTEQRPYNLRRRDGFKVPKYNYSIGRTSLSYRKAIVWTILPESYKLSDSQEKDEKRSGTTRKIKLREGIMPDYKQG